MVETTPSSSGDALPDIIYMDNAATSWPKPPEVIAAMASFLAESGGNPGRSGHRLSIAAGRVVLEAREAMAALVGIEDPFRVVFTLNVTHALNTALFGLLSAGDRVVTTSMEHNSVMRPLRELERRGVEVVIAPCDREGFIDVDRFAHEIGAGAQVACFQHASNVTGTLQPIAELVTLARQAGTVTIVDAAQTAGAVPIDLSAVPIDIFAFTGHKALLGPPGTGGLILGPGFSPKRLQPLVRGGTGSRSESDEHPDMLPDRFEAGTPNGVGLAGLAAGVQVLKKHGVAKIRAREVELTRELLSGLGPIPGVTVYGPADPEQRTPCLSIRVAGRRVDEVGLMLDEEYGILTRVGLHCAPAAHRTLGTFPEGTVRLAPGFFTTSEDIRRVVHAVSEIAATSEVTGANGDAS